MPAAGGLLPLPTALPTIAGTIALVPVRGVLAHRPFRALWSAQVVSQLGDAVYFLVFLFMADVASNGDGRMVGLVGALEAIPFLILSPYAGRLADVKDRRTIMAASSLGAMAVQIGVAIYAWFVPIPPVAFIAVIAFTLSCVKALWLPASMAAIPRVAPEGQVMEANGLVMTAQQVMGMLGIALSAAVLGPVYALMPERFLFAAALFDGLTFMVCALMLLRLPKLVPIRKFAPARFWDDLKEGFSAVKDNPVARIALPTNVLVSLCIAGFFIVYLQANRAWFGGDFGRLAIIELSFMLPMAIFSLLVPRFNIRRPGLSFAVASAAVGVLVAFLGYSQQYWLFILWNVIAGAILPFAILPISTYLQVGFADEVRGRVNGLWTMAAQGVKPIGLALMGFFVNAIGLTGSFVVMGLGMALVCLPGLFSRAFRTAELPEEA